jgi:hypothetical protein
MALEQAGAFAQPLSDRVEAVARMFLEGDQGVLGQEHAHLLRFDLLFEMEHAHDDVEVVAVVVDLRALAHVEHVFVRERMEAEQVAELADDLDVADAVDVDPEHARLALVRGELRDAREALLLDGISRVVKHLDRLGHVGARRRG